MAQYKKFLLQEGVFKFHSNLPFEEMNFVNGKDLLDFVNQECIENEGDFPKVFDSEEDAINAAKNMHCTIFDDLSICGHEITAEIPFVESCICDNNVKSFDPLADFWDFRTIFVADF